MFLFFSSSAQEAYKSIEIYQYNSEQTDTISFSRYGTKSPIQWGMTISLWTGTKILLDGSYHFSSMWEWEALNDTMLKGHDSDSNYYIKILANKLGCPLKNKVDPSLEWLLEVSNIYKGSSYYKDSIITREHTFRELWVDGEPSIPDNYSIVMPTFNYFVETYGIGLKKALIYYYAHNHKHRYLSGKTKTIFETLFKTKYGIVLSTGNGLVLQKDKKHRWIFINDALATNFDGKLRWSPIKFVISYKNYLALCVPGEMVTNIYVIDLEKNIIKGLSPSVYDDYGASYFEHFKSLRFENGNLVAEHEKGKMVIPFNHFK